MSASLHQLKGESRALTQMDTYTLQAKPVSMGNDTYHQLLVGMVNMSFLSLYLSFLQKKYGFLLFCQSLFHQETNISFIAKISVIFSDF